MTIKYKSVLMIDMGTQRTHAVGREDMILSFFAEVFLKGFLHIVYWRNDE